MNWPKVLLVTTSAGCLLTVTSEVQGRDVPPIAAGPVVAPRQSAPPVGGGPSPTRIPIDGAGPTTTTAAPPFNTLCPGGTRIEAETAKSYVYSESELVPSNDWTVETSPSGYSGAGFISNANQSGMLVIPFTPTATYYEVRTRDITGGGGATRVGYYNGGPIDWPVHNDWGVTVLGTWRFRGFLGYPERATWGALAPGLTSLGESGYLGIDYFDFCPVDNPLVAVKFTGHTDVPIVVVKSCYGDGGTSAEQAVIPVGGFNASPLLTMYAPMASTCAFYMNAVAGYSVYTFYNAYSPIDRRVKSYIGQPGPAPLENFLVHNAVTIQVGTQYIASSRQ